MPFKVETRTTVVYVPNGGGADNSGFIITMDNGDKYLGAADWVDGYPAYKLCLKPGEFPLPVQVKANEILPRLRALNQGQAFHDTSIRALIVGDLCIGTSPLRVEVHWGRWSKAGANHVVTIPGTVVSLTVDE